MSHSKEVLKKVSEAEDKTHEFSSDTDSVEDVEKPPGTIVEADVHKHGSDSNFILNKFLSDSNNLMIQNREISSKRQMPVPAPRKLKIKDEEINNDIVCVEDGKRGTLSYESSPSSKSKIDKIHSAVSETNTLQYENEKPTKLKRRISKTEKSSNKPLYTYEELIAITLHKTDRLKLDSLVVHPLVKVHIIKVDTGEYLLKSNKNRSVVFYYEDENLNYVTPVLSQPYNLYKKHTTCPAWEETIVINEDINYFLNKDTMLFFEIVDFVSFNVVVAQSGGKGLSQGWHKIAWAFFKPIGKNGAVNINKRVRLQLYYPHKYKSGLQNECPIYDWWKCKKLVVYPSTLYVTVSTIRPPGELPETTRSKVPYQAESATTQEMQSESNFGERGDAATVEDNEKKNKIEDKQHLWSRLNHQTCKMPNKCVAELSSFEEGCFVLKFSNSGLFLACAVLIEGIYSIVIYMVKTFQEKCRYSIHQGLIYDIIWSVNDEYIITSSADCTVSIWSFKLFRLTDMLPHPSYVYATDVHKSGVIATGCYDCFVRIWLQTDDTYDLIQELEGHKGYVTSLCFSKKHLYLYSSDSVGNVNEWKRDDDNWALKRELTWIDLKGIIINQILLHKRERRLLIHARDSVIRIIDLKTGCTLQWLKGAMNNRFRTICSFSPCGTFVFAGGEYGSVSVWNIDLGQLVANYTVYSLFNISNLAVHCVLFHPHDNIIAIAHYGNALPILLCTYDGGVTYDSSLCLKLFLDSEINSKQKSNTKLKVKKNFSQQKVKNTKIENVIQKMNQVLSN
ncbi:hypothetical protein FQA39_LY01759 [Lamprigera yunnana]|nr:hypothetical protein FQA39_LY01759 [Lamprigera yunnana]